MTPTSKTKTELLSELLDLHLSRTIKRHEIMNKFEELAIGIEQDLANWDQQADELLAIRENNRRRGELVFSKHREKQATVKAGLDRMEQALTALEGSNSKKDETKEGSDASSTTSFQSGEK